MERLTTRSHWPDGHWVIPLVMNTMGNGYLPQDGQYVPQAVIDRLAAYEDTGLTPEDITSMASYIDQYGDVSIPSKYEQAEADIYYEFPDPFYNDGRMRGHEAICSFTKWGSWTRFYLTREEAEAALEDK